MRKIIPMKMKQSEISSSKFNINSKTVTTLLKKLIALVLAIMVAVFGTTSMLQISANFYQIAIGREMTIQDLMLIAAFSGAAAGVIISNIRKMYLFFEAKLNKRKDEN